MKQKAPVEKNQVYEMTITGQGSEGQGIGRVDGFAVFVPDALPGEVADVKILKVQKQFAYGKIETLKITSPDRTEPKCPLARRCGGCALQHMTYDAQLRFKTQKVKDAIGGQMLAYEADQYGSYQHKGSNSKNFHIPSS